MNMKTYIYFISINIYKNFIQNLSLIIFININFLFKPHYKF
jgi:hypothetical protein